ncbi:hypothetical protein [Solirubrum puertoriconensis]|uniref:DUF1349 domain-containing protein n=1 Tax=Solirubrum puertoriconensis TaxID=1751427 RepID=A0A9X0L441_SOLP1|nr:hypothetical protein [Solirubrum puertoriconensis]KUG07195.1 hypothetical protein ASU33_12540 [Solirubrum puertoriconensis]
MPTFSRIVPVLAACWLAASAFQPPRADTSATPSDDLGALSDDFNDAASLGNWKQFHQAEGWPSMVARAEVGGIAKGLLYLEPTTSGWYADFHGAFMYKEVTGDFFVTSRLKITGKTAELPATTWSLAGLMVREARPTATPANWKPNGENWLFLTAGIAEPVGQPVFESKTTVNSRSNLKLRPAKTGWVELGIMRVRAAFVLLYRYDGETQWHVHERFYRRDMPRTVQVGLNAYTDWYSAQQYHNDPMRFNTTIVSNGKPDLGLHVDYVRFQRPGYQASSPMADASELTDYTLSNAELLKTLRL